jgi:hypothetical protein
MGKDELTLDFKQNPKRQRSSSDIPTTAVVTIILTCSPDAMSFLSNTLPRVSHVHNVIEFP